MVHFIPSTQRRIVMLATQADTAPVLIYGASGTGKSAIAKWIHTNSPRSTFPLVTAIPDTPIAEQLTQATNGTFTLPEVSALPLSEQKTLLKFLSTKTIPHPQKKEMPLLLNIRIIACTSHVLEGRAQGGLFNHDLLKKLNVFRIEMPALAKRMDEFEDIVMALVGEIIRELHKDHVRGLSEDAWNRLKNYEWPGNLRELRNILRVATVSTKTNLIEETDLPDFGHDQLDFSATREEFETIYIKELLKTFNWDMDSACQISRIDKKILLAKIKKYGIELPKGLPK